MKNLKIFDNINSYLIYRDSDDFLRPSCNWYRIVNSSDSTVYDKNLPFVDNTLNYNLLKYKTINDRPLLYAIGSSLTGDVKLVEDVAINDGNAGFIAVFDNYLHRPLRKLDDILDISDFVIRMQAFISEIELPDTIEYIEDYAFSSCAELTKFYIGKQTKTIGEGAFSLCSKLSILTIASTNLKYIGHAFISGTKIERLTFENKSLQDTTFCNQFLYDARYLKTIILKSILGPQIEVTSTYDIFRGAGSYYTPTEKHLFIPINYDPESYDEFLTSALNNNWNVSHQIKDTRLTALTTNGYISNCSYNGSEMYISPYETTINYKYEISNINCTDALTNTQLSGFKISDVYKKNIGQNTTYNSRTFDGSLTKYFINPETGAVINSVPFNYSVKQWGKPMLNLETNNSKTGWRICATGMVNGKPHLMFRNNNAKTTNSACNLKITYKNTPTLTIYVRNAGEANYDYTCISKLNSPFTVSSNFYYNPSLVDLSFKNCVTNNTISSYTPVHFKGTDEETTFSILYRKDSSADKADDSSYLLIPEELYINISNNYLHDQTRYVASGTIVNKMYNAGSTPTYSNAYWTNTKIGTYGVGNKDAYFVNNYQLAYTLNEHSKIGTTDVIRGTINLTKCGPEATQVANFLPYHKFGTSATASTKTMKRGDKIAFSSFDNKNNTYRVNTLDMYVSSNNWSTYDRVTTNVNRWYLPNNEFYWTNKQPFDISVNLNPYTTSITGSNCFGWQQITTSKNISNSTTVTVMASIPSQFKNYGKLYCTTNSYKNATNSVSIMTVDVKNSNYLDVYHKTCGEQAYDYLVISQPNVTLAQVMNQVKTRSATFSSHMLCYNGYSTNSVTNGTGTLSNFTHLRIDLSKTGTHTNKIHFVYRKDSSNDKFDDAAYIFIPN